MTEEELAKAQARLEAQTVEVNSYIDRLNQRVERVRFIERELILCAAVLYLAGIVFGVVLAKQWWGL